MRKVKYLFFIAGLALSFHCIAWNALGHRVAANIAYERLQPNVRAKVDKMVIDLSKEYPDVTQFTQIAPWPDTLRAQKIDTFTHWHYINIAFSADATPLQDLIDDDNAVWAISKMEPVIKNSAANAYERARFLAFLVHVVADLHQPLHTVARISARHPEGDHGGNLYFVHSPTSTTQTVTLHKLWDDGLDIFSSEPSQKNVVSLSKLVTSLYPESYFGAKVNDLSPEDWANEGVKLAETFVYTTPEDQLPSSDYMTKGKEIAEQRVALAGYRLANLLNQLLG